MGTVYKARDPVLDRLVALKTMSEALLVEEEMQERFYREARSAAGLQHVNIVTVFDLGEVDGAPFIAMELLDGASLDRVVSVFGPLRPSRVVHILYHVAEALTEAHEIGLIHRDIKPANILLCRQGGIYDFPKVVDFGLVKDLERGTDARLTQANVVQGTPLYLSPEAISDPDAVDARSDLYSLGAVGYYLLTGTHVFTGKTLVEVCSPHLHSAPESPSQRLGAPVPSDLEELLLACLAKDAAARPFAAAVLRDALAALESAGSWTPTAARTWWTHRNAKGSGREC